MRTETSDTFDLVVAQCAVLGWFDRSLLRDLGISAEAVDQLLASDLVEPASDAGGRTRLQHHVRAAAVEQARAGVPFDQIVLHTDALRLLLARMAEPLRYSNAEDDALEHLDRLFFMLAPREQWQTLAGHAQSMRGFGPRAQRTLAYLTFYESAIALNMQRYDEAETVLAGLLSTADLDIVLRMRALNFLALTHFYQSHYAQALVLYDQLLPIARAAGDALHQGIALVNSGMIYHELDQLDLALDRTFQGLAQFRAAGNREREVTALYEIGNTALRLGRWSVAERYLAEAIALATELQLHARLGNLYWAFGLLHHLHGNLAQSEVAYRQALAIAADASHPDHRVLTDTHWFLGFLYATQDRWEQALGMYDMAIALASEARRDHALSLIHYQRGTILVRQGQTARATEAMIIAIDHIERLRMLTDDEDVKISLLGSIQQIFETMVLLCIDQGRLSDAFVYVERARSRAFLDAVARREPELFKALDQPAVTLPDVQAALAPDARLIEYFTTGVVSHGDHMINNLAPEQSWLRVHLAPPPRLLIFAITRESITLRQARIDPNVLRPEPDDRLAGRHLLDDVLLAALYDELIAPVDDLLHGCRQLFLIPHGPLHYVPFAALRNPTGRYLLDAGGPAIALAPSATVLLHQCLTRPPSDSALGLAIAWNGHDAPMLTYAEAEAQVVAGLMDGQAWCGYRPKREALKDMAPRLRWLHIACHAAYYPRRPLDSYLRLGDGDLLSARTIIHELRLHAALVSLSACVTGLSRVAPGDELLGLLRAFLYAGAATIVCTLWETDDMVALLTMYCFYTALRHGSAPAVALHDTLIAVRSMTGRQALSLLQQLRDESDGRLAYPPTPELGFEDFDRPIFDDPYYWAGFLLIGSPY